MQSNFERVANATVTLTGTGGRGVLVPGKIILTAAHCIACDYSGSMVLRIEEFRQTILTATGEQIILAPLAIEPVNDIAALGPISYEAEEKFDEFCDATEFISIWSCDADNPPTDEFKPFKEFPVYIYNKDGSWVTGSAKQQRRGDRSVWVETDKQIEGGASGGPIVTSSGELVGIVSVFNEADSGQKCNGASPRPLLTLPVWIAQTIMDAPSRNKG
jgi:hypothetical protein